METGRCQA